MLDALGASWALRRVIRFLLRRALGRILSPESLDAQQARPCPSAARRQLCRVLSSCASRRVRLLAPALTPLPSRLRGARSEASASRTAAPQLDVQLHAGTVELGGAGGELQLNAAYLDSQLVRSRNALRGVAPRFAVSPQR